MSEFRPMIEYHRYARRSGCLALVIGLVVIGAVVAIDWKSGFLGAALAGFVVGLVQIHRDLKYLQLAKETTGVAKFYHRRRRWWRRRYVPFLSGIVMASVCGVTLILHFVLVLCGLPGPLRMSR